MTTPPTRRSPGLRFLAGSAITAALVVVLAVFAGLASSGTRTAASAQYAPQNTAQPSISGSAVVGQTLTANTGNWSNVDNKTGYGFTWQRCDSNGANCSNVNSSGKQYTLGNDDVGHRIRVVVTATSTGGASAATSNPTGVVVAASGTSTTPAPSGGSQGPVSGAVKLSNGQTSVPVSSVSLPQRLVVDKVQFQPSQIHSRSQPLVVRFHVVDTRGYAVRGALVYAVGVPAHRISTQPEQATATDGWVSFTFAPQARLPIRKGATLVLFVRARKPGEPVLAGVSTRRLVQVRVNPG